MIWSRPSFSSQRRAQDCAAEHPAGNMLPYPLRL
jgi:hypothetical protein